MEGGKEPQVSAAPRVASGGDAPRVKRLRRRRGPGAPTAPPHPPSSRARRRVRPAPPHLASSSSGVSGHLAVKWAVTALDAEAVRAPSSESQSAVKPRSSRITPAAFAMVRPGKHEPLALSPQPAAATLPPAPPVARPPTSGGGSASPLLGPGPGRRRAHAPSAPAPSREPPRADPWAT